MEDADGFPASNNSSVFATDTHLTNGAILPGTSVAEGDDQSSSLSDIDDGPDEEDADDNDGSLGEVPVQDDSEAETERLEDSPHKLAKHKNVILSSNLEEPELNPGTLVHSMDEQPKQNEESASLQSIGPEDAVYHGRNNGNGDLRSESIPVLVSEPCDGSKKVPVPPEVAGKKRKRASPRSQEVYEEDENVDWVKEQSALIKSELNGNNLSNQNSLSDQDIEERRKELEATASEFDAEQAPDDEKAVKAAGQSTSSTKVKKGKTGKRKGKKLRDDIPSGTAHSNTIAVEHGYGVDHGPVPDVETIEEEEETIVVEGDVEEVEAEVAARTEEECEFHVQKLRTTWLPSTGALFEGSC